MTKPALIVRFTVICPFLLFALCLLKNFGKLRNFVLVPYMSSKVHLCSMEGQTVYRSIYDR